MFNPITDWFLQLIGFTEYSPFEFDARRSNMTQLGFFNSAENYFYIVLFFVCFTTLSNAFLFDGLPIFAKKLLSFYY